MKFLLVAVNAKFIHTNLALYNLKSCAQKYEEQVELAEYTINHRMNEIMEDVYRRKPDVIGFSCYIWNIAIVEQLIVELHKVLPEVPIWLGGPEVSWESRRQLERRDEITGIMVGEGELTFRSLMAYYSGENLRLEEIPGLIYREGEELVSTGAPEQVDLSRIPFPYQDLGELDHKIIYYESSRGCPFSCSYCLSSIDKRMRFRNLEQVYQDLDRFLEARVPQVKFVDRTFNCKRSHSMPIWRYLTEHDNGVTNFHFEISADLLQEEEIALMRTMRPGLIQLEIGVQSIHPQTLEAIGRQMDLDKLSQMVKKIQAGGNIHQHLDLIAGLPWEDYEKFEQSFDYVYGLKPDQLQLGFLKVLKGTGMKQQSESFHIISQSRPPYEVLSTAWLGYDEVLRLKAVEEMTEVYYNSCQFRTTLSWLLPRYGTPFAFFESLADYYEEKGYRKYSHSRLSRYEIIYEFLTRRFGISEVIAGSLLAFDYCLREKMKKVPEFIPDQNPYRRMISDFYAAEAERHRYFDGHERLSYRELVNQSQPLVLPGDIRGFTEGQNREVRLFIFDYSRRSPLDHNAKILEIHETDWKSDRNSS